MARLMKFVVRPSDGEEFPWNPHLEHRKWQVVVRDLDKLDAAPVKTEKPTDTLPPEPSPETATVLREQFDFDKIRLKPDLVAYGEKRFGRTLDQFLTAQGMKDTLYQWQCEERAAAKE